MRLANCTDNSSAKMATAKGVIQGYTSVATVDAAHQAVVDAQAHGTGSEQELLLPVIEVCAQCSQETTICADVWATTRRRTLPSWRHETSPA